MLHLASPCDVLRRRTWPTFLVLVIRRYTMQHDAHAKFPSNLTADGLTSQRCLISLPAIPYTTFLQLHSLCLVHGCLQIVATLPQGMTSVIQREEWYLWTLLCSPTTLTTIRLYSEWSCNWCHTKCGKLIFFKDSRLRTDTIVFMLYAPL